MAKTKRIGILTSGGDCPGLNAAIRATAKAAILEGYEVIGIKRGWKGLLDDDYYTLDRINTSGIIDRGGTILGSSRLSPLEEENGVEIVFNKFDKLELQALVVLGGEGTLSVTSKLHRQGLKVVGIPKTIDNDVKGTSFSIGFQTAVQVATDALDRLRSTAESHHRIMLLEVMGRTTGWIATYAGMANGADAILIPEIPMNDEKIDALCRMLELRSKRGANFSVIVVAEGTLLHGKTIERPVLDLYDSGEAYRFGGIGTIIGSIIENRIGIETRVTTLGYVQRGGTPVAYDRSLATAFGVKAVNLISQEQYGMMTALKGNTITYIPLSEVEDQVKTIDLKIFKIAKVFFG
jgi:phosphofructokinase-like protein